MEKKCINISYTEYASINELGTSDQQLLKTAIAAADSAYAPYSSFNVGAAVKLSNGEIVAGSNQENAAYPSGLCAERTTIFYAHAKFPEASVETIALAAKQNGVLTEKFTYPCGACRQVLHESQLRSGAPIRVIVGSATKVIVLESVNDLLPFAFDNLIQ